MPKKDTMTAWNSLPRHETTTQHHVKKIPLSLLHIRRSQNHDSSGTIWWWIVMRLWDKNPFSPETHHYSITLHIKGVISEMSRGNSRLPWNQSCLAPALAWVQKLTATKTTATIMMTQARLGAITKEITRPQQQRIPIVVPIRQYFEYYVCTMAIRMHQNLVTGLRLWGSDYSGTIIST